MLVCGQLGYSTAFSSERRVKNPRKEPVTDWKGEDYSSLCNHNKMLDGTE